MVLFGIGSESKQYVHFYKKKAWTYKRISWTNDINMILEEYYKYFRSNYFNY